MQIVLKPIELAYLAGFYAPRIAAEIAERDGFSADDFETTRASLQERQLLQPAETGEWQIARPLSGWVSACINPDVMLCATATESNGVSTQFAFNLTTRLFVEDSLLPTGEHVLSPISEAQLTQRVQECLCLREQPAGIGEPVILKTAAFEEAVALAPLGKRATVAAVLRTSGLDFQEQERVTDLLFASRALGAVGWRQMLRDGKQQGLAFLETSQGLWRLDTPEEGMVSLSPVTAQQLGDEVVSLTSAAMAAVP
ncbi:MAG: hypothetical protein JW892_03105 [Anaerolineae bacterium]|nr:hypothetical protein [Anaerolineae bacterium]